MIKRIKIENYRCFKDLTVDIKQLTILVGKNNAGKSTLIEVLRIISIVAKRCTNLNYSKSPDWLTMPPSNVGVMPSIQNLEISTRNLFYRYGEPPAKIVVSFINKSKIEIYIGERAEIFALIYSQKKVLVTSKSQARKLGLKAVNILPQIGPILKEEKTLKRQTVKSGEDTNLSSRHFRNQLRYNYNNFSNFRGLAEKTWDGLAIRDLDGRSTFEGGLLTLIVREGGFAAEIGWMGHGLQMWLQTIWFLSKCDEDSTIILDEPDVYMHADLQRRLIRQIKGNFNQIIIATHSVEIISEVDADNIMPVDSTLTRLNYASHTPMVQEIIENIGSVHNLEIARIFSNRKFLIVEGDNDDTKLLGIFNDLLFDKTKESIETIPKTYIEGWGGWQRVIGSNKVFRDTNLKISTYCFLDSDYHTEEEKKTRYLEAKKNQINLHIWKRKEIENYVISSEIVHRTILKENSDSGVTILEIEKILQEEIEKFKEDIIDSYATEISDNNKRLALKTVNQQAREIVNKNWDSNKLSLVPGKKLVSALSKVTHNKFKVSLNSFKLARNMIKSDLDQEVIEMLVKLDNNLPFQ